MFRRTVQIRVYVNPACPTKRGSAELLAVDVVRSVLCSFERDLPFTRIDPRPCPLEISGVSQVFNKNNRIIMQVLITYPNADAAVVFLQLDLIQRLGFQSEVDSSAVTRSGVQFQIVTFKGGLLSLEFLVLINWTFRGF